MIFITVEMAIHNKNRDTPLDRHQAQFVSENYEMEILSINQMAKCHTVVPSVVARKMIKS